MWLCPEMGGRGAPTSLWEPTALIPTDGAGDSHCLGPCRVAWWRLAPGARREDKDRQDFEVAKEQVHGCFFAQLRDIEPDPEQEGRLQWHQPITELRVCA